MFGLHFAMSDLSNQFGLSHLRWWVLHDDRQRTGLWKVSPMQHNFQLSHLPRFSYFVYLLSLRIFPNIGCMQIYRIDQLHTDLCFLNDHFDHNWDAEFPRTDSGYPIDDCSKDRKRIWDPIPLGDFPNLSLRQRYCLWKLGYSFRRLLEHCLQRYSISQQYGRWNILSNGLNFHSLRVHPSGRVFRFQPDSLPSTFHPHHLCRHRHRYHYRLEVQQKFWQLKRRWRGGESWQRKERNRQ